MPLCTVHDAVEGCRLAVDIQETQATRTGVATFANADQM